MSDTTWSNDGRNGCANCGASKQAHVGAGLPCPDGDVPAETPVEPVEPAGGAPSAQTPSPGPAVPPALEPAPAGFPG